MLNTHFFLSEIIQVSISQRLALRGIYLNDISTCQAKVNSSKHLLTFRRSSEPIFSLAEREIVLLFVFSQGQSLAVNALYGI